MITIEKNQEDYLIISINKKPIVDSPITCDNEDQLEFAVKQINKYISEKDNLIKECKSALQSLCAWGHGSQCNDCDPFRAAPSCIEWMHHKDCEYLKSMNQANKILRFPELEYHEFDDPGAEMQKLAQERYSRK